MSQTPFQLSSFISAEHGQTMSEYAMLLAFIVIIVMATVALFGGAIANFFSQFTQSI